MVDNNENKHLKVDLALDRTFLALLRTAGVLTGIAAILIKQKKALVINRIFIIILIILLLWGTFSFSKYIRQSNIQKGAINNSAYISLCFSGLLILLLIMMLLYSFNLF